MMLLKPGRIRYVNNPLTATTGWAVDRDNPLSPAYVPVEERSEMEKAIWWADLHRRKPTSGVGVFDDGEVPRRGVDRGVR